MKILIVTKVYLPAVGGMEKFAFIMADTFHNMGHNVVVLTEERSESNDSNSFKVVRTNYFLKDIIYYTKRADVCIISGFSLKYFPFTLFNQKNIFVFHNPNFGNNWQSHIKQFIAKFPIPNVINVTVSNYVGKSLRLKRYKTIYNPYENDLFRMYDNSYDRKGFIYVGRICENKGVELLIRAYLNLQKRNPYNQDIKLDIIGDGPQRLELESFVKNQHLDSNITFKGILAGESLVKELNSHKFQVIPSVWGEAFGIVALEGMASGCIEICSDSDGLQEAIGNNGFLFKKGDVTDLTVRMEEVLKLSDEERVNLQNKGLEWVKNFTMENVCKNYLKIMQ